MANTGLSALIPSAYKALDVVSRELVGAIPAVTMDASVARGALGQQVLSFKTKKSETQNTVPSNVPPNPDANDFGNVGVSITKSKNVMFSWEGEEELGLNNNGAGADAIRINQIAEAMRALTNEVESDIVAAARVAASRAYGTPGTTPFATDLKATAELRKILDDNGTPMSQRSLIIDTTAGVNLRTLTQLTKVNEAGSAMTLRDGELLNLHGFSIHESAAVKEHTKGTGASYLINKAGGYAVGDSTITVDGGTGTILPGDVVTFAGDSNKYVVTSALSANSFHIGEPGLQEVLADNAAVTVLGNATAGVAFAKSAIILAARQPALPKGGDMAVDRGTIVDPRSGLAFELAMYPGFRQMEYFIGLAWGVKGIKEEHTALLLG